MIIAEVRRGATAMNTGRICIEVSNQKLLLLREFIKSVILHLDEAVNPQNTDDRFEAYQAWLESIVAQHSHSSGEHVYLRFDQQPFQPHLSLSNKNNTNDHQNHLGVWTYMLERPELITDAHNSVFGFGSYHVTVLQAACSPAQIIRSDSYSESDLRRDVHKLGQLHGHSTVTSWQQQDSERRSKLLKMWHAEMDPSDFSADDWNDIVASLSDESMSPFARLDAVAAVFASSYPGGRRRGLSQLYRDLGYKIIEDPDGVIDSGGNCALGLTLDAMKVIDHRVFNES